MLKAYAIENLKSGMVVGRDVNDPDEGLLVRAGTVLNNATIFKLLDRPIFSIYIEEEEKKKHVAPTKRSLLDAPYVACYQQVYGQMEELLSKLREGAGLDIVLLESILSAENMRQLCDGSKAVSQLSNMDRSGDYLVHHSLHLAILAGLMGRWLRYDDQKRHDLVITGLLLDIGKIKIPDTILSKKGPLSDEEFRVIQKHAEYGYEMLKDTQLGTNRDILFGVLQHHERCDGSGYPYGVCRAQISDFGRIMAILDIYDAMTADRSYAKKKSPFDIFAILHDDIMSGKLDTEYGVYFTKHFCHALNGSWVRLSTGEVGHIVYLDESRVDALPIVQTLDDQFIDLSSNMSVKVEAILNAEEAQHAE